MLSKLFRYFLFDITGECSRGSPTRLGVLTLLLLLLPGLSLAAIWHVDGQVSSSGNGTNWTQAFQSIHEAVGAAAAEDEIWVKQGPYLLSSQIEIDKVVALYGGFDGTETQRSQRDWEDNTTTISGRNSVRGFYITANATIDGFTIENGYATESGTPSDNGGGIFNSESSPTINNCTFSANRANRYGGGIYNWNASPTITNCTFSNNNASDGSGGGIHNTLSSPIITDCTFSNNGAIYGGGITNNNSFPTISNCLFSNNGSNATRKGGGIFNSNSSSPTITNCTFSDNHAGEGGGIYNSDYSSPTITNCTFSGNSAYNGGGILNLYHSSPTIINSMFLGNSASFGGGILNKRSSLFIKNCTFSGNSGGILNKFSSSSSIIITNSVLWGNGDEITNRSYPSSINVTYSNVKGGYEGEGNIDADPLFVNAIEGDLHLNISSPAINSGTSKGTLVSSDFEGNPRPSGNGYDMGAYEYQFLPGGVLQFSQESYNFNENDGSITITVTRIGGSSAVSVNYSITDNTTTAGSDYIAVTGTVSWGNGDTSTKSFTVNIIDDNEVEGNETAILNLGNIIGSAELGSMNTALLTIQSIPELYKLTTNKNGAGEGSITGQGINCGSNCSKEYVENMQVSLTATPTADSIFDGWSGACSGTGTCQVNMTSVQNVTATFKLDGPPITNQCVYKITPTNRSHGSNVETGSITVSVQSGCSWTAQSNTVWANITSGSIGEGNGSVTYLITANSTSQNRSSGTLTIAGQTFTLFQNSIECSYSITPTNHSHSANAETGSISVKVPTGCQWTAHSTVPWVNVTAGHNGQGAGIVTYSIDPNTSLQNRQGTLTIAGQTFTVNQGTPPNTRPTPVVSVTPSQGKPPLTVTADGRESYDREGIIETYAWTTSDGQTASTQKTSFTFTKEGNYDITLVVTDDGNLSDSLTKPVTVSSATTYLSNLSTRARIQGGASDIIAGFGIRGKETQRILLRGISLEHGVDPELVLQNYSTQEVLGKNNNWEQDSRHTEIPRGMRPDNENDAALLRDLPKGYYTVQLSSKGAKALGIVEVIRLSKTPPVNKLFNISTRALVQGGAYDIIAGFIIKGEGLQKVVIRGTAVEAGVDPVLILQELGKSEVMAQNDNWLDSPRASEIPEHLQFGLKSTDAALLLTLPEGKYTVILTSLGAKKLGLIEVVAIK